MASGEQMAKDVPGGTSGRNWKACFGFYKQVPLERLAEPLSALSDLPQKVSAMGKKRCIYDYC